MLEFERKTILLFYEISASFLSYQSRHTYSGKKRKKIRHTQLVNDVFLFLKDDLS